MRGEFVTHRQIPPHDLPERISAHQPSHLAARLHVERARVSNPRQAAHLVHDAHRAGECAAKPADYLLRRPRRHIAEDALRDEQHGLGRVQEREEGIGQGSGGRMAQVERDERVCAREEG